MFAAKILDNEKRSKQSEVLKEYFNQVPMNSLKFCLYMGIECITLIILIVQLVFLDWYLHHAVTTYGLFTMKWFWEDPSSRTDPLIVLFPRFTDCDLKMYGPGMVTFSYYNDHL